MSEVNADGVLLNPHEALLQEVQALSNSLMAEKPEGMEDDKEHTVYAANGEPAGTVGGIPHMPTAMAAADLVLCRSGASTLAELSALGKPAVLVPSPNVVNNHQEKNARVLERAGAARVIVEREATA